MGSAAPTVRLLIVALDGADGRLLERGAVDGALPNLAALRRRGRAWRLNSDRAATDDSLWASFQYGVGAGEHGRSSYVLEDDRGRAAFAETLEQDREIFWERLSADGRRVAVLDVPKCRPPRPLNGLHLTDWLVHGRYAQSPRSYPPTLAEEVVTRFGPAPPSRCGYAEEAPLDDAAVAEVRANLLRSVEMKRRAALHFLAQGPWDAFIVGFKEAHCAAHGLWHLHDPAHRRHDPEQAARVGDPLLEVLEAQDAAVGALVRAAGPGCRCVVFSTSDFAPNGSLMHLMGAIAERISDAIAAETDGWGPTRLRRLLRRPRPVCRSVWRSDDAGAIRVPRRPDDTDAAHRARVERVAELARELVDPADGSAVIAAVSHPAFEQTGSRAASLPHVLLHYRPNICPDAVASPTLGPIRARPPAIRAGNHVPGGFAIAAGPDAGALADRIRSMADFAAAATAALSARPVPAGLGT